MSMSAPEIGTEWNICGDKYKVVFVDHNTDLAFCVLYMKTQGSYMMTKFSYNHFTTPWKDEPKVVTIKRWGNVYSSGDSYHTAGLFDNRQDAVTFSDKRTVIDTVEIEITFTDRRGIK